MQALLRSPGEPSAGAPPRAGTRNTLLYGAIAFSLTDALVHAWVLPEHFEEWWGYGAFFLFLAAAQTAYAAALFRWPDRRLFVLGIVGALGLVSLYAVTRMLGIPWVGPHAGHAEEVGAIDLVSKAAEVGLLVTLVGLLRAHPRRVAMPGHEVGEPPHAAPRRRSLLGHPLGKLAAGVVAVLVLLAVGFRLGAGLDFGPRGGTVTATDAEACARQGCDIHFMATLATRGYTQRLGIWKDVEPRLRTAQAFVLTATAHAGTVRALALDDKVFLEADGVLYPSSGQPVAVTSHHNTYLVFFPRYDMLGRPLFERESGQFRLVLNDVDASAAQRTLTFKHPLPGVQGASLPLPQVLMTIGAAMAALIFACTPCLVGSLTVGSLASGTATSQSRQREWERVRRALVRQALFFLAALVLAYLAVAVLVGGFKLDASDLRPVEAVGGLVLLAIGARLLGDTGPGLRVRRAVARLGRAAFRRVGARGERPDGGTLGRGTSAAMGTSLAMVCSVAGAPTLSTAIVLPILVYAGLAHPLWAFALLLVYLVVCAVPFFFIAVGWGELLLKASVRARAWLLGASGVVLVALGLLLVVSPGAVADALSTPARLALVPLRWLS